MESRSPVRLPESAGPRQRRDVTPAASSRVFPRVLRFGTVTFSLGILAAAFMGSFTRLSGDDYCYGAVVREHGFLGAQVFSFLDHPPYHGDRYASTFVSGAISQAGPAMWASWAGLSLLGWVAASTWCGWQVARLAGVRRPFLIGVLGAVMAVFLTVYQAPDRVQSVYWWSANVLYLAPLALEYVLAGLLLSQATPERGRKWTLAGILVVAFVAGGFSEAVASFQMAWLILALGTVLVLKRRLTLEITGLAVALLGAGLSLGVLIASPFSRSVLASLGSHPPPGPLLLAALRGGVGFLRETLQGLVLPTVLTLGLGAALGALLALERETVTRRHALLLPVAALVLLGAAIILAAALLTPSLYSYNALPDARAELGARHAMVLAFLAIGIAGGFSCVALVPAGLKRSPLATGLLAGAIALMALYPLWGASRLVDEEPSYRRWAVAWDARHDAILKAQAAGDTDLHVVQIDHLIPSVSELTDNPTFWYNVCAAGFYGVHSITADLPGWGE